MVTLITLLSSGKGTWGQVNSLLKAREWKKIYLICNDYAYKNFTPATQNVEKILFDEKNISQDLEKLSKKFKEEVKDIDVAINISSGTGMEHMAILTAVLGAGLGIRFVYADFGELKEFEIIKMPYVAEDEEDEF